MDFQTDLQIRQGGIGEIRGSDGALLSEERTNLRRFELNSLDKPDQGDSTPLVTILREVGADHGVLGELLLSLAHYAKRINGRWRVATSIDSIHERYKEAYNDPDALREDTRAGLLHLADMGIVDRYKQPTGRPTIYFFNFGGLSSWAEHNREKNRPTGAGLGAD